MSDNKTYERLHAALKDIKESNDAIYAALVAILAHLQGATSFDDYSRMGAARENIKAAHNHICDECDPKFL